MVKTRGGLTNRPPRMSKNRYLDMVRKVTAKETKERGDRMFFGFPPMELPFKLYHLIVAAVEGRRLLKPNLENQKLIDLVHRIEVKIKHAGDSYKGMYLPVYWEYDPDTAATLVDHGCLVPVADEESMVTEPRGAPKTSGVPLTEREKEIWQCFTQSDRGPCFPEIIQVLSPSLGLFYPNENESKSIALDNPMVGLISNFAVDTYNKVYEMLINNKEHKRIECSEILKCSYMKILGNYNLLYTFYMIIRGVEEGKVGLYKTKVVFEMPEGWRKLSRFVLTPPEPTPKEITHIRKKVIVVQPETEDFKEICESDEEKDSSSSAVYYEDPHLGRLGDTGMCLRRKGATCRGYDFYAPGLAAQFDGP